MNDWFDKEIKDCSNPLSISRILNSIYATKECEHQESQNYTINEKIILNSEIEILLRKLLKRYLEMHKAEITALDILKEGTALFTLFTNCCVENLYIDEEGLYNYRQPGFAIITEFFSSCNPKPSVDEYHSHLAELFKEDEPDPESFEDPNDYYQWQEYDSERYEHTMVSHFGNRYSKELEEFKNKCFQPKEVTPPVEKDAKDIKSISKSKIGSSSKSKTGKGKRRR